MASTFLAISFVIRRYHVLVISTSRLYGSILLHLTYCIASKYVACLTVFERSRSLRPWSSTLRRSTTVVRSTVLTCLALMLPLCLSRESVGRRRYACSSRQGVLVPYIPVLPIYYIVRRAV